MGAGGDSPVEAVHRRLDFHTHLRVSGMGESTVEERLDLLIHSNNPTLATYAKVDAVDVRITAKAETAEEAERQVAEMEVRVRRILGHHIFGTDKDTLQGVVGNLLQARQQSLAVMESLTGGLLSSTITDTPNSSKHFIGGIAAYSIKLKEQMGVPHETIEQYGTISEQTARGDGARSTRATGGGFWHRHHWCGGSRYAGREARWHCSYSHRRANGGGDGYGARMAWWARR